MCHGFKVFTVAHYLGSFIGGGKSKNDWLKERTNTWEKNIHMISETAGKYTQEIYAAVVHTIQSEWIFLKLITKNTGDVFTVVEKILLETFLPCLLFRKSKTLSLIVGNVSTILVKKAGMGLLNPVMSTNEKYISLQHSITELI